MHTPSQTERCPRFATCNAPYCPLDPGRARVATLQGEAVCVFLRRLAEGRQGDIPADMDADVAASYAAVMDGREGGTQVAKKLRYAARKGTGPDPVP